ncbi:alpha-mannosidase [bacterium]|nr:alpha-mannosidase [bacterium]
MRRLVASLVVASIAYTASAAPAGDVLRFIARPEARESAANLFVYYVFSTRAYTIEAGDALQYDIYIDGTSPRAQGGVELVMESGAYLRDSGLRDRSGLSSHGNTELAAARDAWTTRRFDLSAFAGRTVAQWLVVQEGDRLGNYTQYLDNVVIVRGEKVVAVGYENGPPEKSQVGWLYGYPPALLSLEAVPARERYAAGWADDRRWYQVNLSSLCDSRGVAKAEEMGRADLDGSGRSLPGEEFPYGNVTVSGVPFAMPAAGAERDNVVARGQTLDVSQAGTRAVSLFILATGAPEGAPAEFVLRDARGQSRRFHFDVPYWCEASRGRPVVGMSRRNDPTDRQRRQPKLWLLSAHAILDAPVAKLILPDSPHVHVFAVTLGRIDPDHAPDSFKEALVESDTPGGEVARYLLNYKYARLLADVSPDEHRATVDRLYAAARRRDRAGAEQIAREANARLLDAARAYRDRSIFFVANCHIDLAWLWRWRETVEVCRNTFSQMVALTDDYPALHLHAGTAVCLCLDGNTIRTDGRDIGTLPSRPVEIVGGSWGECDTNLPCEESLIRQVLYGKRYFRETFGKDVTVGWLPDSFGFSRQLPQIYRKAGLHAFVTTKMNWNKGTEVAERLFWWQAPDGSRVLTLIPYDDYIGNTNAERQLQNLDKFHERYGVSEYTVLYGAGDKGGGPTRQQIEEIGEMSRAEAFPEVRHATIEFVMDNYERKYGDQLPVYDDELYLQYHQGTYTTHGWVKKANRESEVGLINAEKLASLAAGLGLKAYPARELGETWRLLCFNQFHDILPGSSIPAVYADARIDFDRIRRVHERVRDESLGALAGRIDTAGPHAPIVVVNTLGWARDGEIWLDLAEKGATTAAVYGPDGRPVPAQVIERGGRPKLLFIARGVPAHGYAVYRLEYGRKPKRGGEVKAGRFELENEFYRVGVDKASGLVRIFDRRLSREVIAPGTGGNQLHVSDDLPTEYDAWNIRPVDLCTVETAESVELIEQGGLRGAIRVVRRTPSGRSTITSDIVLYSGLPRIDFETTVDWHERRKVLKAAFPMNVTTDVATYEIPGGHVERAAVPKVPSDTAEIEVPAQRWADMSERDFGVSLLNDGKYGYDARGNLLRLTLLRAPIPPGATRDAATGQLSPTDQGMHRFTYSIYSHASDWRNGSVRQGYGLNYPLLVYETESHAGELPAVQSFLSAEGAEVVVSAVKQAEEGDGVVVRFYETAGRGGEVRLRLYRPPRAAWRCNLLEENQASLSIGGDTVIVPTGAYSIETVKLEF